MKKMNKKGFTIVELVIVIAVIAILAAVMIPTFSGIVEKANISALEQKVSAGYKEAMAEDLADDGLYNNSFGGAANRTYTASNGFIYSFTNASTGACSVDFDLDANETLHGKTGATISNGVLTLTPED